MLTIVLLQHSNPMRSESPYPIVLPSILPIHQHLFQLGPSANWLSRHNHWHRQVKWVQRLQRLQRLTQSSLAKKECRGVPREMCRLTLLQSSKITTSIQRTTLLPRLGATLRKALVLENRQQSEYTHRRRDIAKRNPIPNSAGHELSRDTDQRNRLMSRQIVMVRCQIPAATTFKTPNSAT